MAGAWAVEANGKPKAAADNKEIKSLFMDANVLKNQRRYCRITCGD
jgi:hypothetical protein